MQEYVVNRPDAEAMERILLVNSGNAAGTILRLAWQAGLLRDEIQHLTWAQIDFLDSSIVLPDRSVPIAEELAAYLAALREGRRGCPDVVVLSDRDKKPLAPPSISRLARQALDAGEQRTVRLIDLRHDFVLRQKHSITCNEAAALLGVSHTTAYHRLKRMTERGKLTQIGARYYFKEAVVPPEQHETVILEYLTREGFAYRQDIARILKIEAGQCRPILKKMIAAGQISQQRQRYILKKEA